VAEGARVVGLARSAERLDAIAQELGSPRFVGVPGDVSDASSMDAAARRILGEVGTPDVIVANAGIGLDALFQNTTDDALRAVFEVNVFGVYRSIRPFLPAMLERGSGRIVIVSSVVGERGIPFYSAYSASKFALAGMCDALRPELAGTGVTVGLVCPTTTASEFQARLLREGPSQRRVRLRSHPPESVARAIVEMARSRRRKRVLTLEGKLLAWAGRFAPGLVDRFLARTLTGVRSKGQVSRPDP
jgi:NAD(P)-dependent dehydrogenase (short-subunit alcohol dehydrogenase family)